MLRHETDHLNKTQDDETTSLKQEHAQETKELQDDLERKVNAQRAKSKHKDNGMLDAVKNLETLE